MSKSRRQWSEPVWEDPGMSRGVVSWYGSTDYGVRWYSNATQTQAPPVPGGRADVQSLGPDGILHDHGNLADAKKHAEKSYKAEAKKKADDMVAWLAGPERLPLSGGNLPTWKGAEGAYAKAYRNLEAWNASEAASQRAAHIKRGRAASTFRYDPPQEIRDYIAALDGGDEEQVKWWNMHYDELFGGRTERLPRKIDQKSYKFYVVVRVRSRAETPGLIESGWDYREDANDHLKEVRDIPLVDAEWRVLTRRFLEQNGRDPADNASWVTAEMLQRAVREHREQRETQRDYDDWSNQFNCPVCGHRGSSEDVRNGKYIVICKNQHCTNDKAWEVEGASTESLPNGQSVDWAAVMQALLDAPNPPTNYALTPEKVRQIGEAYSWFDAWVEAGWSPGSTEYPSLAAMVRAEPARFLADLSEFFGDDYYRPDSETPEEGGATLRDARQHNIFVESKYFRTDIAGRAWSKTTPFGHRGEIWGTYVVSPDGRNRRVAVYEAIDDETGSRWSGQVYGRLVDHDEIADAIRDDVERAKQIAAIDDGETTESLPTRYPTNKSPSDPTYSAQWSGVTGAPKARGLACASCGGPVHREGESYYCPSCDDYVRTTSSVVLKKMRRALGKVERVERMAAPMKPALKKLLAMTPEQVSDAAVQVFTLVYNANPADQAFLDARREMFVGRLVAELMSIRERALLLQTQMDRTSVDSTVVDRTSVDTTSVDTTVVDRRRSPSPPKRLSPMKPQLGHAEAVALMKRLWPQYLASRSAKVA